MTHCIRCGSDLPRPVEIGDAHGKIALYLEQESAEALAMILGPLDRQSKELHEAIAKAYPPRDD